MASKLDNKGYILASYCPNTLVQRGIILVCFTIQKSLNCSNIALFNMQAFS